MRVVFTDMMFKLIKAAVLIVMLDVVVIDCKD